MQLFGARDQDLLGLRNFRIGNADVDRAHGRARLLIEEADALGALLRDDVEDVIRERGVLDAVLLPLDAALVDGRVRALRLARAAVDALGSDHRRHRSTSPSVSGSNEGFVACSASGFKLWSAAACCRFGVGGAALVQSAI